MSISLLASESAVVLIDRDAAHDAAERELSKPIYPKQDLLERINDWINDFIYRFVSKGAEIPGGWFTVGVLLALVAAAIITAVWIARRTMKTSREGDFSLFGAAELSAAEHRASAERFAAEGNWSSAIRHRLRAVARQLEESGVLNAVPGRTANELARDAAKFLPELTSELAAAAASFNEVTYGERAGTEAAYNEITELDERIRSRRFTAGRAVASRPGSESWAHLQ
ncbi:MAG: DUF4129 domain-containing protein [Mycobacteriaceae bacterium]|nr:DUF4129 domain-containing protein [Mycobacteriaceae bacterium]